jgi:very-short-patch-repair endonuclease
VKIDFSQIAERLDLSVDDHHPGAVSQEAWASRAALFDHFDLDAFIEEENNKDFGGIVSRIVSLAAGSFANSLEPRVAATIQATKSPIEAMMAAALWMVAAERMLICAEAAEYQHAWIDTQHRVGRYTADIRLTVIDRSMTPPMLVAFIECDGHDFHEKTKEQVSKDKERDRVFQKTGALVLRYSGSDIWRDPIGAAMDAIETAQTALLARAGR